MAGAYPFKDGASIFSPAAHGLDLGPALATFAGHQPVILNLLAGAGIFGGMIWILVAVPTGEIVHAPLKIRAPEVAGN